MQALYQAEVANIDIDEALNNLISNEKFIPETVEFASVLARAAWKERHVNDKIIETLATDWPLDRLGKVDHSILRMAFFELKEGETPASVVINEAVELAKKYLNDDSAKFINGILGAYQRMPKQA